MDFGTPDAAAVVIEQLRVVTARAQGFDQAACLPVRSVIDALVESKDADLLAASGHARPMRAPECGSDLQRASSLALRALKVPLEAGLKIGLVEAELLGLLECVRSEAHRAIFADDLPVGGLVEILELEQLLG